MLIGVNESFLHMNPPTPMMLILATVGYYPSVRVRLFQDFINTS